MAMKVTYTVVNGEVLSENRGGVKRDYLPDPLGSTVALLNNTQTQTDTFSYWPYGENNARTGTTATPFQFVGRLGYRRDAGSRTYVRARTLRTDQGRWMTEDPIGRGGGDENLFRYVSNQPVTVADPSGLSFTNAECKAACGSIFTKTKDKTACVAICKNLGGSNCGALRARCSHLDRHPSEGSSLHESPVMILEYLRISFNYSAIWSRKCASPLSKLSAPAEILGVVMCWSLILTIQIRQSGRQHAIGMG